MPGDALAALIGMVVLLVVPPTTLLATILFHASVERQTAGGERPTLPVPAAREPGGEQRPVVPSRAA